MINKLCSACIHLCKQEDTSKIVSCPKFKNRPTEKEFREMVENLSVAENEARKHQKGIRELIKKTLPEKSSEQDDNEDEVQDSD